MLQGKVGCTHQRNTLRSTTITPARTPPTGHVLTAEKEASFKLQLWLMTIPPLFPFNFKSTQNKTQKELVQICPWRSQILHCNVGPAAILHSSASAHPCLDMESLHGEDLLAIKRTTTWRLLVGS